MNRSPRPGVSSNSLRTRYNNTPSPKPPISPGASRLTVPGASSARQTLPSPRKRVVDKKPADEPVESPKTTLSLKEQIALKRAEAKKATRATRSSPSDELPGFGVDDNPMVLQAKPVEDEVDVMGRWSVRETIERARSSGNLNISSRSLVCLPSCLYEIHLGIMPKPLESVTEPEYPIESTPQRTRANKQQPSWYEAQDLTILKARSNEITALQPELALFGSLKVIDLHRNHLSALPTSMAILSFLTNLDLSNNDLTEIHPSLFSLPALTTLNVAHNQLTSLPFSKFDSPIDLPESLDMGAFFQPEVARANLPLPKLQSLDAGHNKLCSSSIDMTHLPSALSRLTLADNPLGPSSELFAALSNLENLQEVHMSRAKINDSSFTRSETVKFPKLQILDLSETDVTEQAISFYFSDSPRSGSISFHATTAPPSPGELRVSVGKKVIKEKWEIEAEQHYLRKKKSSINVRPIPVLAEREPWESEAEQGLTTKGARKLAPMAGASTMGQNKQALPETPKPTSSRPAAVEKERWEIEAELGLTTEAGRRKLRAQQARLEGQKALELPSNPSSRTRTKSLAESPYYTKNTQTLALPPSVPPTRSHSRTFSLAARSLVSSSSSEDISVPTPTLPLDIIVKEDFAANLRVLTLSNRRADSTFHFPPAETLAGILPRLEELSLNGCALGNTVAVSQAGGDAAPQIMKKGVLEVLADTFPNLTMLDLSYNTISSDGLYPDVLKRLLVPSAEEGKGLKILRLRGNRMSSLEAFEPIAELFRGNRQVSEWRLEELDVQDNEISKLPVLLGLMPLDVFLVDGNTFRIPQRRVWEREGTRGLLSWLRGRIE